MQRLLAHSSAAQLIIYKVVVAMLVIHHWFDFTLTRNFKKKKKLIATSLLNQPKWLTSRNVLGWRWERY